MKIGVLTLHGFTGVKEELDALVTALKEEGFETRNPMIPGHGTRPEDMLKYSWKDWAQTAIDNYLDLRKTCDLVFVVGHSMGGTNALFLAEHALELDGIVTLAPSLFIRDWRTKFIPIVKRIMKWQHGKLTDIKDPSQVDRHVAYDRFPIKSAVDLFEFQNEVRRQLWLIRQPLLSIHSKLDKIVDPRDTEYLLASINSEIKEVFWLTKSGHNFLLDYESDVAVEKTIDFIKRVAETKSKTT